MTMSVSVAQMRIARELQAAELALDEALLKQSSLMATLISARREAGKSAFEGQAELMRLVKSQSSLLTAGGDLARVHGGLLDIGRERSDGVIHDCPPNEPTGFAGDDEAIAA